MRFISLWENGENDDTRKNMQFYAAAYRKIKDFPNDTKVSDDLPGRPSIIFCLTSDYFKEIVDDSREDFIVFLIKIIQQKKRLLLCRL